MPKHPVGSGSLFNPDHGRLCDDLDLLTVLGGKPRGEVAKELISSHKDKCTWCARPGWGSSLVGVCFTPPEESELRPKLEAIFGQISWAN